MRQPELELTGPQTIALEAMLGGATVTEAATKAGVSRQTVSGWRNHHEGFGAALEDAREEFADTVRCRVLALCGEALGVLAGVMRGDAPVADRIRAASRILDLARAEMLPTEGEANRNGREYARQQARLAGLMRGQ
jgi:transposase-like protein